MAVHRDALSAQVARPARTGAGASLHLRCSDLGGWLTKIAGQALEMGPNGADRHGAHSAASRSARTSGLGGPAGGASAIGAGELTPPERAGIPHRGAVILGDPPTDLGRPTASGQPRALPLLRNERAGRPIGRTQAHPGPRKTRRVCGRARRGGKEASRTGKCSPPDGWNLAEMTSAAGLVAGGERRWRGGGVKARAKTAQEPMMCRLTCANVAERARIYGILSRELPPLCAPRTRLFRHRRAVAL